jgi:hypothetical protein
MAFRKLDLLPSSQKKKKRFHFVWLFRKSKITNQEELFATVQSKWKHFIFLEMMETGSVSEMFFLIEPRRMENI